MNTCKERCLDKRCSAWHITLPVPRRQIQRQGRVKDRGVDLGLFFLFCFFAFYFLVWFLIEIDNFICIFNFKKLLLLSSFCLYLTFIIFLLVFLWGEHYKVGMDNEGLGSGWDWSANEWIKEKKEDISRWESTQIINTFFSVTSYVFVQNKWNYLRKMLFIWLLSNRNRGKVKCWFNPRILQIVKTFFVKVTIVPWRGTGKVLSVETPSWSRNLDI